MKKNKIIYALLLILAIALVGGLYAWKEYNRKSISLTDTKAQYSINAKDLINSFSSDEKASNVKYLSQVLAITGYIQSIDTGTNKAFTIVLAEANSQISIRCSMDSSERSKGLLVKKGQAVAIKGIYTGFNADELGLGSDIILNKCILIKE